jgi:hypothetical protein
VSDELTQRFVDLVCRELGAAEVAVLEGELPEEPLSLRVALAGGKQVVARFAAAEAIGSANLRRLEILVRAFEEALIGEPQRRPRAPVASSLREELRALASRASSLGALVIDAHSPVIWAATSERIEGAMDEEPNNVFPFPPEARETLRLVRESHRGVLIALGVEPEPAPAVDPTLEEVSPANEEEDSALRDAVRKVRTLRELAQLHKGSHLNHTERGVDGGYIARSFAGIYCLVLVFDQPFDEIRAERAVRDALPRIERLVLALPPLDPEPLLRGAVAKRPRRG